MPHPTAGIELLDRPTTVAVPYGSGSCELILPAGSLRLCPEDPQRRTDQHRFRDLIANRLCNPELDLSRPVLVVTDKTRLCDYPDYLPIVVEQISEQRRSNQPFPIIIAYGTHPRQSDEESSRCYGPLFARWPTFVHHDCDDSSLFVDCGHTQRGTPIRLRRDLLEASAVITMGPICHHYFAGYGGGRKLIFPGCGERQAIYANHGLFLDRHRQGLSPGCQPGELGNNPLAQDLFDMESRLPASLAIHGIQDSAGRICDFLVGSGQELYRQACRTHAASYELSVKPVDTVIASCGGYPKDINFIQAHKTIHNSAAFVRDGGLLVVFAECRDGVGSQTFLPWFGTGYAAAFARLAERYEGNGGTALAMQTKTARIRVCLVTALDRTTCQRIGCDKGDLAMVARLLEEPSGTISWIANGSLLVNRFDS